MKRSCWLVCAALLVFVQMMSAQVQKGLPPFGSFSSGPDVINLGNLNVHFEVPVFAKPGRGTPFTYTLGFDSSIWTPVASSGTTSWQPAANWGWTAITEAEAGYVSSEKQAVTCIDHDTGRTWHSFDQGNFQYHDGSLGHPGLIHPFDNYLDGCQDPTDMSVYVTTSTDGSGLILDLSGISPTIKTPYGATFTVPIGTPAGAAAFKDRNGNQIATTNGTTFTDTLGMTALTASGGAPNPLVFTYTDSSGTAQTVTMNYVTKTVQTNFGCSGVSEYGPTPGVSLVTSIHLPDGSSYSFDYEQTPGGPAGNVTGRIKSITVRTGSTITYTYTGSNNGIICSDGSAAGFTRTTTDGTTAYARGGSGTAWTTTVTDASTPGNDTVISFQTAKGSMVTNFGTVAGFYETRRVVYQGSASANPPTQLLTTDTCYPSANQPPYPGGTYPPCTNNAISLPFTYIRSFVTLDNGLRYLTQTALDNFGNINDVAEYDAGKTDSSFSTSLLRHKTISYASLGNGIVSLPSVITVFDGGTTQVSQTSFAYDETTPTATSGVPQHTSISGSRGNLTSTKRWLDTAKSTLTTSMTYDDTGNMLTSSDPGGHMTQFSYADSFSDGVNRSSLAYLTQITSPDTNSPNLAHHITKMQYDAQTGLPVKTTDQNGNQTTFTYDSLLRPLQTTFPDGGQTTVSYQTTTQVLVQNKIDSTRTTSSYTQVDGYGRLSRTAVANGESTPYDQQDSCYDSNGRLGFRSYPYQGSGFSQLKVCSGAGDTFAFDALGRTTQLTHSDGATVQYTYAGRAKQVTDEGNGVSRVSRITQSDRFGRLSAVCEVSASTLAGSGGTPAACGLDTPANGFLTTYGYNLLDNLTSVTQGSLAPRSYSYDSLSRKISETTPEAGTVTYGYNGDSLLTTRVRPAPKQSDPTKTFTTTYAYDELHRPRGWSYTSSDPTNNPVNTSSPTFNYDEGSLWNTTLNNTVGRLSSEMIGSPLAAEQIFSYDAMGRTVLNAQCTPNTCNVTPFAPYSLGYQYDFLGDKISAGNGAGVTFAYSYNIAGRLTEMTSSLHDVNHPAVLLSGAHYSPSIVTDTLGNGVVETTNLSPRGLLASQMAQVPSQRATGAVTITGSERNIQVLQQQATPGQASVTITGALQSKQVQTQAATSGTGSVTINGAEQSFPSCTYYYGVKRCLTVYDGGSVSVTVSGLTKTVNYGRYDTASGLASSIASLFNGDSTSCVNASVSGATINLTARSTGTASNCSLSATSATNDPVDFGPSFTTAASGTTLTGGANAVFSTVYDSGSCTITVNLHGDSNSWSGSGTSAASIAAGLQSNIAGDASSPVNANVANNVVSLTAKTGGSATNYPLSSSCTYDSGNFSGPSFSTSNSGSALAGGQDAGYRTVYDTGTVTATVNGFSKTVSYGPTDTPATLASSLASALSYANDPNSPVTASSSGGTLTLTAIAGGAATDYSYTSSSTTNNANFTGTSFPISPASSTMTGGTSTLATLYSYNLTSAPDGQVIAANDFVNGNWTYGYDEFNRLASSNKNSGQQAFSYDYDRYGNRWDQNLTLGQGGVAHYVFDNNNRIVGSGVSYDALGNVSNDGFHSYTYDAENRLIQVDGGTTATYVYDAEGRRVHGPNGEYVYDLSGRMVTQFGLNGAWNYGEIYASGRHLATYSGGTTNFFHPDWVGTKRLMTGPTGAVSQTCTGLPFGDGVNCGTGFNWSFNSFTDDVHDPETNLEHTLFRQLSGTEGRWTTPDPSNMNPGNPQSANRYAYAFNNPIWYGDPDGRSPQDQHEFFTFWLAVAAGRPDAYELAYGAWVADTPQYAAGFPEGLFGGGMFTHWGLHFPKPGEVPSGIDEGIAGGLESHTVEDAGSPTAPHSVGPFIHSVSNIFGESVDRADWAGGGFQRLGEMLGLAPDDPSLAALEAARLFVNHNGLDIVGIDVFGSTLGEGIDGGSVTKIKDFVFGGVTVNIYRLGDAAKSWDDPYLQKLEQSTYLPPLGTLKEQSTAEAAYLYFNNLSNGFGGWSDWGFDWDFLLRHYSTK